MLSVLLRLGLVIFMVSAKFVVSAAPGAPENITVTFLTPSSVQVTWSSMSDGGAADKYDVMYKPTDASYRVITIVAGNVGGAALQGLLPGTQYQLAVTAVRAGRKLRSRPIVFRTLGKPRAAWKPLLRSQIMHQRRELQYHNKCKNENPPRSGSQQQTLGVGAVQVRGVEIGIVLVVLLVWAAAIALFFNRWGKIRMLLPYQPDYKEQLKAASVAVPPPVHASGQPCAQHLHWSRLAGSRFDCSGISTSPSHQHRPRLNSVFAYGAGHPAEQLHFTPVCRKALSAENLPLTGPTTHVSVTDVDNAGRTEYPNSATFHRSDHHNFGSYHRSEHLNMGSCTSRPEQHNAGSCRQEHQNTSSCTKSEPQHNTGSCSKSENHNTGSCNKPEQ